MKEKLYKIVPKGDPDSEFTSTNQADAIKALADGSEVFMTDIEWTPISLQINRVRTTKDKTDGT